MKLLFVVFGLILFNNEIKVEAVNKLSQAQSDLTATMSNNDYRYASRDLGDDFIISQNITSDIATYPSITTLKNGNVFIIWVSGNQAEGCSIYGRIFSSDGTLLVDTFTVNQNITNYQTVSSSLATLNDGNVFVGYSTGNNDIYGQVFLPNGTTLNNEFLVTQTSDANAYQNILALATLNDGNVFVAWYTYSTLYGQVFLPNGTALSNIITVNQNSGRYPALATLNDGNVFTLWSESTVEGSTNVYGRLLALNGAAVGNEFMINQNALTQQYSPASVPLNDGSIFTVWVGIGSSHTSTNIHGRVFLPNGTLLSDDFIVNQNTTGFQSNPAIVSFNSKSVFVAWQGASNFGNGDIYGRIFALSGAALSDDFIVNQNVALYDSAYPTLTLLDNNNIFVVWANMPSTGNSEIYGRILTSEYLNSILYPQKSDDTSLIIGIVVGVVGFLLLSGIIVGLVWRYLKNKKTEASPNITLELDAFNHSSERKSEPLMSSQAFVPRKGEGIKSRIAVTGNMYGKVYELFFQVNEDEAKLIIRQTGQKIYYPIGDDKMDLILGKGNFGQVRVAREVDTDEKLFRAIKIVAGEASVTASLREGKLQARLNGSENVLPLLEYLHYLPTPEKKADIQELLNKTFGDTLVNGQDMTTQPLLLQVTPLASFGNGETFQKELNKITDVQLKDNLLKHMAYSLINGLKFMHDNGVSHLDIKPSNLLVHTDGTIYIGDFGCSLQKDKIKGGIGDLRYFSPERLAHIRYLQAANGNTHTITTTEDNKIFSGKEADMWAAGICLLEITINKYPFEWRGLKHAIDTWDNEYYQQNFNIYFNIINESVMKDLLKIDSRERTTAQKALDSMSKAQNAITLFKQFNISIASSSSNNKHDNISESYSLQQQARVSARVEGRGNIWSTYDYDPSYGGDLDSYPAMLAPYNEDYDLE